MVCAEAEGLEQRDAAMGPAQRQLFGHIHDLLQVVLLEAQIRLVALGDDARAWLDVGTDEAMNCSAGCVGEPRLRQLEIPTSPFSGPIERMPGRAVHWAKPELIAGIEMDGWTQDRLIRQTSLKEVRGRTDKTLRPDWINLPSEN